MLKLLKYIWQLNKKATIVAGIFVVVGFTEILATFTLLGLGKLKHLVNDLIAITILFVFAIIMWWVVYGLDRMNQALDKYFEKKLGKL